MSAAKKFIDLKIAWPYMFGYVFIYTDSRFKKTLMDPP